MIIKMLSQHQRDEPVLYYKLSINLIHIPGDLKYNKN